jgi:hypothetical protein
MKIIGLSGEKIMKQPNGPGRSVACMTWLWGPRLWSSPMRTTA